jgi:hypothetical protein
MGSLCATTTTHPPQHISQTTQRRNKHTQKHVNARHQLCTETVCRGQDKPFHLMGSDPKIAPLQFKAAIALSACHTATQVSIATFSFCKTSYANTTFSHTSHASTTT